MIRQTRQSLPSWGGVLNQWADFSRLDEQTKGKKMRKEEWEIRKNM